MIVVLGGTGVVGGFLIQELVKAKVAFRMILRHPERATGVPISAEVCRGDLDNPASIATAFEGGTCLFLLSPHGSKMAEQQIAAIHAAKLADFSHIVKISGSPQAVGADCLSSVGRQHHAVEQALKASDIAHTIIRPSFFMQNLLGKPASFVRKGKPMMLPFDAQQKFTFVDARDIAKTAAKALLEPRGSDQTLHLVGSRMSFSEVAIVLSKLLGRSVRYRKIPLWLANMVLRLQREPAWLRHHQLEMAQVFAVQGDMPASRDLARFLGDTPISLNRFVADHLDAFVQPEA